MNIIELTAEVLNRLEIIEGRRSLKFRVEKRDVINSPIDGVKPISLFFVMVKVDDEEEVSLQIEEGKNKIGVTFNVTDLNINTHNKIGEIISRIFKRQAVYSASGFIIDVECIDQALGRRVDKTIKSVVEESV